MSWVLKAGSFFRQKSQGRAAGQRDQLCQVPRREGITVGWQGMNGWRGRPEECGRQVDRALGRTEQLYLCPKAVGSLGELEAEGQKLL